LKIGGCRETAFNYFIEFLIQKKLFFVRKSIHKHQLLQVGKVAFNRRMLYFTSVKEYDTFAIVLTKEDSTGFLL
jgi:hypothetical protein